MAYTPPQLPPQLQVYEQPYGPPDANGFPGAGPDGCSFYRSLARQMLGNSNHFWIVQDAVLDHYIRVFIDQGSGSGLHARYLTYDNNFPSRYGPFFPALASPDPAIARPPKEFEGDVLSVICNTFNVRIVVWGNNEILLRHKGSVSCPEYNMKQVPDGTGKTGFRFDTLVPDESGSSLVDHLLRVKSTETPLEIREITWWRDPYNARWTDNRVLNALNEQDRRAWVPAPPEQPREYKCYNEHIPVVERWRKPDLRTVVDSFTVFTVSVTKPDQIRAALDLMDEALKRAPAQELPVSYQDAGNFRPLKRYIGIDAEFTPIRLSDEELGQETVGKDAITARQLVGGREEGLCTVLTIAVDRHLVFSFYILHMLQNLEATTVRELSLLFRRVIFNQELLKLWFNYQSDIEVLDATIAHMYQGTPRAPRMSKLPDGYGVPPEMITPTFKLRSAYFQNQRPDDLRFPQGQLGCELHRQGSSVTGLKCPCAETGNVDITSVADFICRQLGYTRGKNVVPNDDIAVFPFDTLARSWARATYKYNYGKFIDGLMGTDRLHDLLSFFKEVPRMVGRRFPGSDMQGKWYTLLRPGMEAEEDMMGYNIGDVVGIALLMRLLTTTDDRISLASKLLNHDHVPDASTYITTMEPRQPPHLSAIPPPPHANLALINDYPKMWSREIIGHMPVPDPEERPELYGRNQSFGTVFRGRPDFWSRPESFSTHEARYNRLVQGRMQHHQSPPPNPALPPAPTAEQIAHQILFDPTDYTLPAWFTRVVNQPNRTTDVNPNTSHLDDLRERIVAEAKRRGRPVMPPRGFYMAGYMQSLATLFDRHFDPDPQSPPAWPQGGGGLSAARIAEMAASGRGGRGGPSGGAWPSGGGGRGAPGGGGGKRAGGSGGPRAGGAGGPRGGQGGWASGSKSGSGSGGGPPAAGGRGARGRGRGMNP